MNHKKARSLIEKHFAEPLKPSVYKDLKAHLDGCAGCRAYSDKLSAFEAAYDGGKGEVDRIGQALFAELETPSRPRILAFTWPFPVIAAVAAAGIIIVNSGKQEDEFAERGGPTQKLDAAKPELQAVCFVDRGNGPEAPRDLKPGSETVCAKGGKLSLAYRNARASDRLVVFALAGNETSKVFDSGDAALKPGAASTLVATFDIAPDAEGSVKLVSVFAPNADATKLQSSAADARGLEAAAGKGAVVQTVVYRPEK